jgi:uracil-DNA glycosylase
MVQENSKREKELMAVRDSVFDCQKCSLYRTRINPVIGEGDHKANILFIGEAPGAQEDKEGRPFCGKAGKILDELLESAEIKRKDVYICNILKCRPPGNRNPKSEEIQACTIYLQRQLEAIRPEVICTLGNYATKYIFEKYGLEEADGISKIHGKIFEASNLFGSLKIIPLYHPAVVTYNPNMKNLLKEDFKILQKFK